MSDIPPLSQAVRAARARGREGGREREGERKRDRESKMTTKRSGGVLETTAGVHEIITSIIVKCVYYFRRPANPFSHISITLVARGGLSESAHDGGEHPLQCDTAHGPSCRPGELNSPPLHPSSWPQFNFRAAALRAPSPEQAQADRAPKPMDSEPIVSPTTPVGHRPGSITMETELTFPPVVPFLGPIFAR